MDLTYTVGSKTVTASAAPAGGTSLVVLYRRLDGVYIATENTPLVTAQAAIERGPGEYMQMLLDPTNANAPAVLLESQQNLSLFQIKPQLFQFQTDFAGLFPGQLLTVALTRPSGAGALVRTVAWVVQQVDARSWLPLMHHAALHGDGDRRGSRCRRKR